MIPKVIYLQICPEHGVECQRMDTCSSEITWCIDRINETDIEYIINEPEIVMSDKTPAKVKRVFTC